MPSRVRKVAAAALVLHCVGAVSDWRSLPNGNPMLADLYLDQPQCVIWDNATVVRWVCTIARNSHPEGNFGEHSEVLYSDNEGLSWTTGIRLETEAEPTNSYGNIVQSTFGRIYVVYNMNLNNVTHFPDGKSFTRDDELGFFVARYSDDGGETWSAQRLTLPQRVTRVDRENSFNGSTLIFWSVDQIKVTAGGAAIQAYTKIGTYMQSAPEQTFFMSSPNLLSERNASAVTWDVFPDGDDGVAAPSASLQWEEGHGTSLQWEEGHGASLQWEEGHVLPLESSPGLFSITRTSAGYVGAASTRDPTGSSGWTLTPSGRLTYSAVGGLAAAVGRAVKNPEGPITLKRFPIAGGGKCLMLFYFNSCPGYSCTGGPARSARNPYWLSSAWEEPAAGGGVEVRLSQPEVVLYDTDTALMASGTAAGYPDFIESAAGGVWVTETNKTHARSHRLDPAFLSTLFSADTINATAAGNVSFAWTPASQHAAFATPPLPDFTPAALGSAWDGLTLALWLDGHAAALPGQALVDLRPALFLGLAEQGGAGAVVLAIADAAGSRANLTMDAECAGRLLSSPPSPHYLTATVDVGAHILTMAVDGVVCDGGAQEPYGWAWVPPAMGALAAPPPSFVLGGDYGGRIRGGAWYSRRLLNTEVVGNFRHQQQGARAAQETG